ncbi:MAG TPA: hypothetical protein VHO84_16295, partial [Syntrophorhabdaceae bacterium]|nr:hypothetical protein [Syntrophorhabdaceae bacterium]
VLTDKEPPQSGVSFYAMTTTRGSTYEPTQVMTPWWSIPLSGSNVAYFLWVQSHKFGITSDYSAPMPYNAAAAPILGNVDAIAVSADTGDVYVSRPITRQITKMQSMGFSLGPEKPFASIPYKDPGQKGLAIDGEGNLYTDNSASDSQFGGRLFKFNASNAAMVFTGTVNYFSQMLMYANPVMVGPMVMGADDQLYVYENMSSTIKAVPVNATYDPYRRVGQNLYTFSGNEPRDVIDMEYVKDASQFINLYVLHGQGISRISSDPVSATKSIESIPLE